MIGHLRKSLLALFMISALLVTGLGLSGCSSGVTEAQILSAKTIATFRIRDDSFFIEANVIPRIDISNGTTRYTMTAQTFLRFALLDGEALIRYLSADDIVIERPEAGILTIIQNRL